MRMRLCVCICHLYLYLCMLWIGGFTFHTTTPLPFETRQLKVGNTIFVRYATRCYFSDLSTEAIKVEDLK